MRRRSLRVALAVLIAGTGTLTAVGTPTATAVSPAVVVSSAICEAFDPNLVSGACLEYESLSGTAYTWIGTYRATDGGIFFCIDYLYDSRISASASRVSTQGMHNQLDNAVGAKEIAALNYLISTRAPNGSAGSANGDAAIALIIREVMSDGIRNDGTVVYKPGLKVHGTVKPLPGGAPSGIMTLAQKWWDEASDLRGPWAVKVESLTPTSQIPLGATASYSVRVVSAEGQAVTGAEVTFACTGPITCPKKFSAAATATAITVKPSAMGNYTLTASVKGPSAQGQLLKGTWAAHDGSTAKNNGVQRGWIAQSVEAKVSASGSAQVVKANPSVVTQAQQMAMAGDALTDLVTVKDLPPGYNQPMTATLYGPFASAPTEMSCTPGTVAGQVTMTVTQDGTFRTPAITAAKHGYYVWTELLPGDAQTTAVQTPCGVAEETTVVQAEPRVVTQAQPTALVGESLSDLVTVEGLPSGYDHPVTAMLFGPFESAPGESSCTPETVAGVVTMPMVEDGTFRTPDVVVGKPGYYVWTESLPGDERTKGVETPCGVAEETTLVKAEPSVVTQAQPTALVGDALADVVTVKGLPPGYDHSMTATLFGPFESAPAETSCAPGTVAGMVTMTVTQDGVFRTPEVVMGKPGYYVWTESLPGDDRTKGVETPCGVAEETTLVKASPHLKTVLSEQRVADGSELSDTVEVSDSHGRGLNLDWSLLGPLAPIDGNCVGLVWAEAPVLDQGQLEVAGDGSYVTPKTRVTSAGCYTYAETAAGTEFSEKAASEPGEPAETTLVIDQPQLRTVASSQSLLMPGTVTDTITVSGLSSGAIEIVWELLGPMAPSGSGCVDLDWSKAAVAAHGQVSSGNGNVETPPTRVTLAGCYTYREHSLAADTSAQADSPAGLLEETLLAVRPPLPRVPEIPTGPEVRHPLLVSPWSQAV